MGAMTLRRHRGRIASLLLGALLFAQGAIAAVVCDMADRAPALAFEPQASMPCHDEPALNANLCLAHCTSTDQSADTPHVAMPAWSASAPLVVATPELWRVRASSVQHPLPRAAGPPPRILFQSFLI
jgi:hypothetical protein